MRLIRAGLIAPMLMLAVLPWARADTDDTPEAVAIVVPADPVRSVELAADELAHYLPRVTGVKTQRVTFTAWQDSRQTPAIVVGIAPEGEEAPEEYDSYRLYSSGQTLYLYGLDQPADPLTQAARKGSLFATYDYLRSAYGIRWLYPGEDGEHVPSEIQPLKVAGFDRIESPDIIQRFVVPGVWTSDYTRTEREELGITEEVNLATLRGVQQWSLRNRLSSNKIVEAKHAFTRWWDKYHEGHPEWFAQLQNGERMLMSKPGRVKLCTSNPEVIEQTVLEGLATLEKHPEYVTITASMNDGALSGWCTCEACTALDPPDAPTLTYYDVAGSYEGAALTDRMLVFWNAVAERMAEVRPDIKVAAYAYYSTSTPPVRESVHPNLLIGFVQQAASYWSRQKWEEERAKFDAWADQGAGGYWRPNALLISHSLPTNFTERLADDLRHVHERGTRYVLYDAMVPHWGTQGHQYYALAHLLWDTEADPQAIFEDYLHHAYGPAAADMQGYFDHLTRITDAIFESNLVDPELWRQAGEAAAATFFTPEDLAQMQGYLDRAAEAAAAHPAELKRVMLVQDGLAFARLQLAVNRELWINPGELNFESGALADAVAARDQWLVDHPRSQAVSAPFTLYMARVMQNLAPRVRSKIDSLYDVRGQ